MTSRKYLLRLINRSMSLSKKERFLLQTINRIWAGGLPEDRQLKFLENLFFQLPVASLKIQIRVLESKTEFLGINWPKVDTKISISWQRWNLRSLKRTRRCQCSRGFWVWNAKSFSKRQPNLHSARMDPLLRSVTKLAVVFQS